MDLNRRELVKSAFAVAVTSAAPSQSGGYLKPVQSHLNKLIEDGIDVYGPVKTPMWMSSLDIRTGRYPDSPYPAAGARVYREISAPNGSSIYWDQPEMVAACALSELTGDTRYRRAVDAYVKSFLDRGGVDEHGLFEWGNHRFYDAFTDKFVSFAGGPHEIRPLTPAWEIFWRITPKVTEREIRVAGKRHVLDAVTGLFNRHDDGKMGDAFLEAGGVLVESLCWLANKKGDRSLVDNAMRIAQFSYGFRSTETGLVVNQPTQPRWDSVVSTTEIGMWAGALIRSADLSGVTEFLRMADAAMTAYLEYGYDAKAREYFGQINVKDGSIPDIKPPDIASGKFNGDYRHRAGGEKAPAMEGDWPAKYANIWNAQFPAHDYPMVFAETCVELYRRTKAPQYRQAVDRWVGVVKQHPAPTTALNGKGAYAELFGRAIQFLTDAGATFNQPDYTAQARKLADASIDILFAYDMFRGHAAEDRYDAVDGVGFLLLALIYLQTSKKPDYLGFGI